MSFFERQKGFTIVELLVVIVVIAILAAIAIVSYNGATEQARSSQRLVALDAWEKSIRVYETAWTISDTGWTDELRGLPWLELFAKR